MTPSGLTNPTPAARFPVLLLEAHMTLRKVGSSGAMTGARELDELILAVAAGNRAAFRALYDRTSPTLLAVCLAVVRNRARAEDVLQDAFVRIHERAGAFDPARGTAMAWLVTVTRRVALNDIRRRSPVSLSLDDEGTELDIADETPETDPIGKHRLIPCLGRLNPDQRQAIVLAYVHGYTHEELARRCDRPLGTIKTWISRGIAELRKCMG